MKVRYAIRCEMCNKMVEEFKQMDKTICSKCKSKKEKHEKNNSKV
jgi:rRNA maturation endonuclease Nob1